MLVRPRLRSLDGCVTCKKRRKKCDETKPICGGCKRLRLRCSWKDNKDVPPNGAPVSNVRLTETYDTKRIRPDPTLNPGPNLSAFTDLMCGTYVLEKCYNVGGSQLFSAALGDHFRDLTCQSVQCGRVIMVQPSAQRSPLHQQRNPWPGAVWCARAC